jgi:hypothetical protein
LYLHSTGKYVLLVFEGRCRFLKTCALNAMPVCVHVCACEFVCACSVYACCAPFCGAALTPHAPPGAAADVRPGDWLLNTPSAPNAMPVFVRTSVSAVAPRAPSVAAADVRPGGRLLKPCALKVPDLLRDPVPPAHHGQRHGGQVTQGIGECAAAAVVCLFVCVCVFLCSQC